jgi:hypothetical protein
LRSRPERATLLGVEELLAFRGRTVTSTDARQIRSIAQ